MRILLIRRRNGKGLAGFKFEKADLNELLDSCG